MALSNNHVRPVPSRCGGVTHSVLRVGVLRNARFTSRSNITLSVRCPIRLVMNDENTALNAIQGGVAVKRLSTP
eukprot:1751193-Amphidinium_carterae.1